MKAIFEDTTCLSMQEIKAYQAGTLNQKQQFRVERHLVDCELCNGAVEGFANSPDEKKDRAQLSILAKQLGATKSNATSFYVKQVAAILVLAIIGSAFIGYWNYTKSERLFARFYEHPVAVDINLRTPTATAHSIQRAEAFVAYQHGDYTRASALLEAYLDQVQPLDAEAAFYAGIAYLQVQNYRSAIDWLNKVRINAPKQYEKATWYLALASLKKKDYESAIQLAAELKEVSDLLYREKAIGLLAALEN